MRIIKALQTVRGRFWFLLGFLPSMALCLSLLFNDEFYDVCYGNIRHEIDWELKQLSVNTHLKLGADPMEYCFDTVSPWEWKEKRPEKMLNYWTLSFENENYCFCNHYFEDNLDKAPKRWPVWRHPDGTYSISPYIVAFPQPGEKVEYTKRDGTKGEMVVRNKPIFTDGQRGPRRKDAPPIRRPAE